MSADRPEVHCTAAPAMGAEVTITTDAPPIAVAAALTVVSRLESRWSRFLATSEVSALNAHAGPALVARSTARILDVARTGRALTDGWFSATRGPTGSDVVIDPELGLVEVPENHHIDLGGIGKGWAADAAAGLLHGHGATFVGVEVGGDTRIRSRHRALVDIEPPAPGSDDEPLRVGLRDGGVAVSGPTKRRGPDGHHHLVDPFTGRAARHPRVAVVIAASATGAEMLATAASIAPLPAALGFLDRSGATAWLVEADGALATVGTPERFVLDGGWLTESGRREWAV